MIRDKLVRIVGLGALLAGAAFAGTNSANLAPSASITSNCTITKKTEISFGAYDPIAGTAVTTTGAVTVACTSDVTGPKVTLGQGANPDTGSTNSAPLRRLKNGSSYLTYNLYSNTGYSTLWTNDTSSGYVAAADGDGTGHDITIYGKIDADQHAAPAGSYTDTVVATVTF